jgi:hypothetical protein
LFFDQSQVRERQLKDKDSEVEANTQRATSEDFGGKTVEENNCVSK